MSSNQPSNQNGENRPKPRSAPRPGSELGNSNSSSQTIQQQLSDENLSRGPMASLLQNQGVYIPTFDQDSFNLGGQNLLPLTQEHLAIQQMLYQQLLMNTGFIPTPVPNQTPPSNVEVSQSTNVLTNQPTGNDTSLPTSQSMPNGTSVPIRPTNAGALHGQTALLRANNASPRPSRPLLNRVRPQLNRDGMSGIGLTHVGVPRFPPVVTDNCNLDIPDVSTGTGRKITKTTPLKPRYNDRAEIVPLPLQKNFDNTDAAKDISALLRVHYKGDFYWNKVSAETRNLLWEQFGMRYRWDRRLEAQILEVWNALNRLYFTRMLQKAKENYKVGLRAKWLFPKYYRRLVTHWRSEEQMKISARNSCNRRGKNISPDNTEVKAPPTYFGGSLGMMRYQRLVNQEQSEGEGRPRLDLVSPLVYGATKSRNCSKFFKKFRSSKKGEQSDPTSSELQVEPVPEWSSRDYEEIVGRYWQFVEEKFATSPHLKPKPSDPYDVECWNKAIKGAKKGRVVGLGSSFKIFEAGFGHRRRSYSTSQLDQAITNEIFEQIYDVVATQPGVDASVRMELDERMQLIADEFRTWIKGKRPMEMDVSGSGQGNGNGSDGGEDDEGSEYEYSGE